MEIKVSFYGVLSEVSGVRIKTYTGVTSFDDLKLRLFDDYPALMHYNYKLSRNSEYIDGDVILKDNDEIALMPPFFGG